jgi:REP-associated tyrosine transposase
MRGNNKGAIYSSDDDRRLFLACLGMARRRCGWRVHMYCLMTNHYHVLVETPTPNIAVGMQWLNSRYAHRFNEMYERVGHLFQRRYADGLIEDDDHLQTVMRYIPLNPVKAGLCDKPEDYAWSSYGPTIGLGVRPRFLTVDWLLGRFAADESEAQTRFREWVEAGLETVRPGGGKLSLGEIFGAGRPVSREAVRQARSAGYSFQEIADHLGIDRTTAWRWGGGVRP